MMDIVKEAGKKCEQNGSLAKAEALDEASVMLVCL